MHSERSQAIHVCHLTSAHPRSDIRVFRKMCLSLRESGFQVSLVVADGKGSEDVEGVSVVDVGKARSRIGRMLFSAYRVYRRALSVRAEIYHLHDPELLWVALLLKLHKKTVVFDSHEDLPKQLLTKPYLSPFFLKVLAKVMWRIESFVVARIDAVVAATPIIRDGFRHVSKHVVDICNYPEIEDLGCPVDPAGKADVACYIGSISTIRGVLEVVEAIGHSRRCTKLLLAGPLGEPGLLDELARRDGWAKVEYLGNLDRDGVRSVLSRSKIGIVALRPTPSYMESLPIKMFEYMGAGLPVLASDFPLWRTIVDDSGCGICVDPMDPAKMGEALDRLLEQPDEMARMSKAGVAAIQTKFNWRSEKGKLLALYGRLVP
ncbi:MAG: glycosyltransferase family 4 protein [Fibrobacteres bacterium]|nr:glycosyltransferase family 4 protein [Fibrobacterota bacterium]